MSSDDSNVLGRLSPGKGLLVLIVIMSMVAIFIQLLHAVGVADLWVPFLFLLYWGMFEKTEVKAIPRCIAGALMGLLLGYLLKTLPLMFGAAGGMMFLGIIFALIYCQLMGWLQLAINAMTMLFLTVATIPSIQAEFKPVDILIALALGVVYFCGVITLAKIVIARRASR
jgi:uncharacterized membrane-anchored protein YitT (DUF2179 family)